MSKPSSFSSANKIAEIFRARFLTQDRRARSLNCGIAVLPFRRGYRTGLFGGFWFEKQKQHFGTIRAKRIHMSEAQNRWIFAQASSSTAVAVA